MSTGKEVRRVIKCYWFHEGSCDNCCNDAPMCSNYRELDSSDNLLELKVDNNFNDMLKETINKYRCRLCCGVI